MYLRTLLLFFALFGFASQGFPSANTAIDELVFDDAKFADCVESEAQANAWLSAWQVRELSCHSMGISSIGGVEAFPFLESLSVFNNRITSLDLSENVELSYLQAGFNPLVNLDVTQNSKLRALGLDYTTLSQPDLSGNPVLTTLSLSNSYGLLSLDTSHNPLLESLIISYSNLQVLDVSHNSMLRVLGVTASFLQTLDLTGLSELTALNVAGNRLDSLVLTEQVNLKYLDFSRNSAIEVELVTMSGLEYLLASDVGITSLDISPFPALKYLRVNHNQLMEINFSNNELLEYIDISSNRISSIDLSGLDRLETFIAYESPLGEDAREVLATLAAQGNVAVETGYRNAVRRYGSEIHLSAVKVGNEFYKIVLLRGNPFVSPQVYSLSYSEQIENPNTDAIAVFEDGILSIPDIVLVDEFGPYPDMSSFSGDHYRASLELLADHSSVSFVIRDYAPL
ncbi:MAG: hypothetical protein R3332_11705 [Pseudohongiellaceae bacterium]|nr:hypothetical protein [Pseudohongiellaceae bacterium]